MWSTTDFSMVSVLANGQKISRVHWNEVGRKNGERSEDEREKGREGEW